MIPEMLKSDIFFLKKDIQTGSFYLQDLRNPDHYKFQLKSKEQDALKQI